MPVHPFPSLPCSEQLWRQGSGLPTCAQAGAGHAVHPVEAAVRQEAGQGSGSGAPHVSQRQALTALSSCWQ